MTYNETNSDGKPQETTEKPRLVLMGEFSAGKSTLTNVLLGSQPLPMRVTATRLPPVQIRYGAPSAHAIGIDGSRSSIDLERLEDVKLEETMLIELTMEADALKKCDIVDMPGVSDPSMQQQYWEDVIGPDDHIIWCTHATQAWRQSEAAIWKILKPHSVGSNLLLVTQFDKLQNDRDKKRVMKRMRRETAGLFDEIYPVSLLAALNAGDDREAWDASGAAAFFSHMKRILSGHVEEDVDASSESENRAPVMDQESPDAGSDDANEQFHIPADPGAIIPRRVRLKPAGLSRERPERGGMLGYGG